MFALRGLVVYILTILLFRFLGRTLQFQARPYDIAVQVLLGSAAANLIVSEDIPLWRAFTSLGAMALAHTAISYLSLWNPAKNFLVGKPAVVVENGQILKANLIQHQITVEELLSALRQKGYHKLSDLEFATLEPSGKLSVVPCSQARPVTPKDLNLPTQYEGLTALLVVDGAVNRNNLEKAGLTEEWLLGQLAAKGAAGYEAVLLATLDSQGQLFVVRSQDVPFVQAIFKGVQTQVSPGLPPLLGPNLEQPR